MRQGTDTANRIRDEALRLFVERGVDAVSVRDIAAAAGIRPSTLYVHWPSREALVAELFLEGYADYARRLAAAAAVPGPAPRRIEAMIRLICALEGEDPVRFRFLLLSQHAHLARVARDERNPIELLARVVAAGIAAGELPPGDPQLLTAGLVGIVVQTATFGLYGRIGPRLAALADPVAALCRKLLNP